MPALNQKPSTAARRGVAPCHSQMSTAGMRMASGHQPNGANDSDEQHARDERGDAADEAALDDLRAGSLFL